MSQYEPRKLTWAALLGRWVAFARSAVALPDDQAGRAMRAAVPDIIALQAVTMALNDSEDLPADQRALGLDRAHVLIDKHTRQLHTLFDGRELHPMLQELIEDAQAAARQVELEMGERGLGDGG